MWCNTVVRACVHGLINKTCIMYAVLFALPSHNRLSLPSDWRGLRDDKLSEVSGIEGCVFTHASGFIGGNHTYQGALAMARKTLQMRTTTE